VRGAGVEIIDLDVTASQEPSARPEEGQAKKESYLRQEGRLAMRFARCLVPLAAVLVFAQQAHATTHVSGTTYTSDTTWSLAGSPYVLDGNVAVAAGATLTIDPGVVVKLNGTFRTLTVSGTLKAAGTADHRITFTSLQDDSIAGDTGGDGATQGSPGQWWKIEIGSSNDQSDLEFVDIRYGGWGFSESNDTALAISGTASVKLSDSSVTYSQTSGIKIGTGSNSGFPGATIDRTTVAHDANGISVNQGWLHLGDGSTISDNSKDGVWFNLTDSFTGPTSSVMASDITRNGRRGVYIQTGTNLEASYFPHGNANNIYANTGKQLDSLVSRRTVDWRGNYWGDDVYYSLNSSACGSSGVGADGHLAFHASTSTPPDGPIYWSTYGVISGGQYISCAYDFFGVGPCQYSDNLVSSSFEEVSLSPAKPVGDAAQCASQAGFSPVQFESDFSQSCDSLRMGYVLDPSLPVSDAVADYESMLQSLFDELNDFGDVSCSYPGSAPVDRMTLETNYDARTPNYDLPVVWDCLADLWWPTWGSIQTGRITQGQYDGQRYIRQNFGWNIPHLGWLMGCNPQATFEPDAVFSNYDGQHYFGRKLSWASSLPDKYNDTQAFDSSDEKVYTVGTADVQQLQPNRTYYTLIRTAPGNSATDTGKVDAQAGVRFPAACHRTWCVFPEDTKFMIHAWDYSVPGTMAWSPP
jgi:hypothetical protein